MSTSKSHLFKKYVLHWKPLSETASGLAPGPKGRKAITLSTGYVIAAVIVSGKVTWPQHVQSEWELGFVPGPAEKLLQIPLAISWLQWLGQGQSHDLIQSNQSELQALQEGLTGKPQLCEEMRTGHHHHLVTVEDCEGAWQWRLWPVREVRLNEGKDLRWKKEQTEFWYHWSCGSKCAWNRTCAVEISSQEPPIPAPFSFF